MLHHDGIIRIVTQDRTYVVPPLRGVAARRMYSALWRIIGSKDISKVAIHAAASTDPRVKAMFAAAVCNAEGWDALVDEVLTGAKVVRSGLPDLTLPADADAVWSCRPAEAHAVAWEALDDQGFFVVPGTLPSSAPSQGTTTSAPTAPGPNDAV